MNQQNKKLEYKLDYTVQDLFLGPYTRDDITICGRIYSYYKKRFFRKPKKEYTYTVNVPYIEDPYFDGQFVTNKILKLYYEKVKQMLIDKIDELKKLDE